MLASKIILALKGSIAIKVVSLIGLSLCTILYLPSDFALYYGVLAITGLSAPILLLGQQYLVADVSEKNLHSASNSAALILLFVLGSVLIFSGKDLIIVVIIVIFCYLQAFSNFARLQSINKNTLSSFLVIVATGVILGEILKIILGSYTVKNGMVIGQLVSIVFPAFAYLTLKLNFSQLRKNLVFFRKKLLARLYALVIQNSSIHVIPLLLTSMPINQDEVGKFLFAIMIVSMPALVLGKYLNDLFYIHYAKNRGESNNNLYKLILIYFFLLLAYLISRFFFNVFEVFDFMREEWQGTSDYFSSLIYLCFAQLVLNPILQMYYQENTKLASLINSARLLIVIVCCILFYFSYINLYMFGYIYANLMLGLSIIVFIYHSRRYGWN